MSSSSSSSDGSRRSSLRPGDTRILPSTGGSVAAATRCGSSLLPRTPPSNVYGSGNFASPLRAAAGGGGDTPNGAGEAPSPPVKNATAEEGGEAGGASRPPPLPRAASKKQQQQPEFTLAALLSAITPDFSSSPTSSPTRGLDYSTAERV
ncbi:unnamed protein product, partial [Ectocarpus sp. 12 AP-2014]